MHFKRGLPDKKSELSLEAIIRLVLVSISLLIAFYVGFAIYEALIGGPDEGSIKSLDDLSALVKTNLAENTPVQRNVYIKHELSIFTFSSGDESVTHGAGSCGNDGSCSVPRPTANAPPRGCGADIENACICMCNNNARAGSDHCSKVYDCKTFPKTKFVAMKNFAESNAEIEGISGGIIKDTGIGRYFVVFGDRITARVTGVNSYWFTKQMDGEYQKIYITQEKPADSDLKISSAP